MTNDIDLELITEVCGLLWEQTKLKIFLMLQEKELCICEIIERLGIKQNMVSHHVSILKRALILNSRKEWTKAFYSINIPMFEKIKINTKLLFNI